MSLDHLHLADRAMRAIRSKSRAFLLWAMMPLALFSARPNSGCICADGHYEPVCLASSRGSRSLALGETPMGGCCGCSCCRAIGNPSLSGGQSCCSRAASHAQPKGISQSSGCCHPLPPTQVVASAKLTLVDFDATSAEMVSPIAVLSSVVAWPATIEQIELGAPPDLVLTLQRFLI